MGKEWRFKSPRNSFLRKFGNFLGSLGSYIPNHRTLNYLAHLLLSCDEEELLVGNFLGDHVSNAEVPLFSVGIQRGIRLHRAIDTYMDNHPVVRQGTRRLHARHGKYAGVVMDVLYDYLLVEQWTTFGVGTLQQFADQTYAVLLRHQSSMPERVQAFLPRMVADNWLVQYGTREGIAFTFSRLQRRVSQPQFLEDALVSLDEHKAALSAEFALFFPDMRLEVQQFCDCG